MKKSIIAAGAASVALAAMPIVGAFAASNQSIVDNINLTVSKGCTITDPTTPRTVTMDSIVAGGSATTKNGAGIALVCNATNWSVSAQGTYAPDGVTGAVATALNKVVSNAVAATIATGSDFTGTSSAWGFKVSVSQSGETPTPDGNITTNYDDYTAVPSSATPIVSGLKTTATITPSYKAIAASAQEPGDYSGQVTYTIAVTDGA